MKLELSDYLKFGVWLLTAAFIYGSFTVRVAALEKAVEPLPQVRIDIEVVKAAVLDIRDDLKAQRRTRRSE